MIVLFGLVKILRYEISKSLNKEMSCGGVVKTSDTILIYCVFLEEEKATSLTFF